MDVNNFFIFFEIYEKNTRKKVFFSPSMMLTNQLLWYIVSLLSDQLFV